MMIDYGNVYEAILADNRQMRTYIIELEAQLAAQSEWQPVPYLDDIVCAAYGNSRIRVGKRMDSAENKLLHIYGRKHGEWQWACIFVLPDNYELMRLRTPAAVDAGTGAQEGTQ